MPDSMHGIKEFYDATSQMWADAWYTDETLMPVLKEFISLLGPSPRVLDLGCGAGYESMRLHNLGATVVGVDFSEASIHIAREKNPDCQFITADFRDLEPSIGKFDGIAAIASLIHIESKELAQVFGRMRSITATPGYLLVVFIQGEGIDQDKSLKQVNGVQYDRTVYLHDLESLKQIAAQAGFGFLKELHLPEAQGWKYILCKTEPSP